MSGPEASELSAALGRSQPLWEALVEGLPAGLVPEWKFYGAKHGWQLKVLKGKRAVLYLIPHDGYFTAAVALNARALAALGGSGLPPDLVREIEDGPKLPEGKAARIQVTTRAQLAQVRTLLDLKLGSLGK